MRWSAALLLCGAGALSAQNVTGLVACRGQRIDSIAIDAQAPTVAGLRRVPLLGNIVRETHVITRDEIVQGFLLLHVGERCMELRRAESERILRAQTFIADASIDVQSSNRGGVLLTVHTIDEASLIVSGAVTNGGPAVRGVRIGSGNLSGLGIATSVTWRYQRAFDDRMEVRATDYLVGGLPYVGFFSLGRDPLGRDDYVGITLPFRTDLQRFAWRTSIGESRTHAQFVQRDSGRLSLGFNRQYAEAGAIGRLGSPGLLSLFGLSFTNERMIPDTAAELITLTGFRPDTASEFTGRFLETRASRVNALFGFRGIRFVRARGLDALRGWQDVPLGLQFGTIVGRAVQAFGANSNDLFVASDLYLAFGSPTQLLRLQLQGEGRRPRGSTDWDGLVGSGRLARYARISEAHTRILSLEWSGTSRALVPHSLTLADPDGGIRGYQKSITVAGRRGVARLDEQWYLGSPFAFGDFGIAGFTDVGQLWAGDLPYGMTTQVRASAGLSLLLAAPMRSTRMWRLEFAAPIVQEPGLSKWQVRLTHSDRTTFFWHEPADVDAARVRAVPTSIYNWP